MGMPSSLNGRKDLMKRRHGQKQSSPKNLHSLSNFFSSRRIGLRSFVKNFNRGLEKANADWKSKLEASEADWKSKLEASEARCEAADAKIAELS